MESYDEKGFELSIGPGVEVLTLLVELNMEGTLRKPVNLEFLNFEVTNFEPVGTVHRHKLDSIFAKMQPTATVISDVVRVEFFMRVRDKKGCAPARFEGFLEIFQRRGEIPVEVQICCRHVGQRFGISRLALKQLFKLCNRIVVFLAVNKIK